MGVTLHFIPLSRIGKRVSFLGAPCLFSGFCARFRLFIWVWCRCFGFYYRAGAIFLCGLVRAWCLACGCMLMLCLFYRDNTVRHR